MGIKEGLLAMIGDRPKHGYQLKLDLEAATGDAISINVGQIYSTLQRLARDGLIEGRGKDPEGREIYEITRTGLEALKQWTSQAETLAAGGRDEITMKVLVALYTEGLDPHQVVGVQRRSTMGLLQDFTQLRATEGESDLAWSLHLDRLIYSAEAELKWLDRVEERLKTVGPSQMSPVEDRVEEGV